MSPPLIDQTVQDALEQEVIKLVAELWRYEMPQLIKLGHAVLDAIVQKGQAGTIANAAVQAEEVAADMAEAARFPKGDQ